MPVQDTKMNNKAIHTIIHSNTPVAINKRGEKDKISGEKGTSNWISKPLEVGVIEMKLSVYKNHSCGGTTCAYQKKEKAF